MQLLLNKVLMKRLKIHQDLQCAVHIAGIAQVLQSNGWAIWTNTATYSGVFASWSLLFLHIGWELVWAVAELGVYELSMSQAELFEGLEQASATKDLLLDQESTPFDIFFESSCSDLKYLVQCLLSRNL